MTNPPVPKGSHEPLDPSAAAAFRELTEALQEALFHEARAIAQGPRLTEDDLHAAYKSLNFPALDSLAFANAQAVVTQALRENRVIEWVAYGMSGVLFLFGLVLLSIGIADDEVAVRIGCLLSGSVVELLLLLPFRFAINSRRHNIALRMLGLVINRVHDPKKLSALLKDTFTSVVVGTPQLKPGSEK